MYPSTAVRFVGCVYTAACNMAFLIPVPLTVIIALATSTFSPPLSDLALKGNEIA